MRTGRATAHATVVVLSALGSVIGLVVEGALYSSIGSHWAAISFVAIPGFLCSALVYTLPEPAFDSLKDE